MTEERFPGEVQYAHSLSSTKLGLVIAGVVMGILLLACGGVVAYVVIVPARPAIEPMSPAAIRAIARKIVNIDVPQDFEPMEAEESDKMTKAVFARKGELGAILKLARVDAAAVPSAPDARMREEMVTQLAEGVGLDDTNTMFGASGDAGSERELPVFGINVNFKFQKGSLIMNKGTPVWRVFSAFKSKYGLIVFIYTIPEKQYDEAAVVKLIESIRPPDPDPGRAMR